MPKAVVLPVPVWGAPDNVPPLKHDGNGLHLDGGRVLVAHIVERSSNRLGHSDCPERLVSLERSGLHLNAWSSLALTGTWFTRAVC